MEEKKDILDYALTNVFIKHGNWYDKNSNMYIDECFDKEGLAKGRALQLEGRLDEARSHFQNVIDGLDNIIPSMGVYEVISETEINAKKYFAKGLLDQSKRLDCIPGFIVAEQLYHALAMLLERRAQIGSHTLKNTRFEYDTCWEKTSANKAEKIANEIGEYIVKVENL